MLTKYKFFVKVSENGNVYGTMKNQKFYCKGFYYQPKNKKERYIIVIGQNEDNTTRIKFNESDIDIQIEVEE